jgi:hypothetical protein
MRMRSKVLLEPRPTRLTDPNLALDEACVDGEVRTPVSMVRADAGVRGEFDGWDRHILHARQRAVHALSEA